MTYKIGVKDFEIFLHIGEKGLERERKQKVIINIEADVGFYPEENVLDYSILLNILSTLKEQEFLYLEDLAKLLIFTIFEKEREILKIKIKIIKEKLFDEKISPYIVLEKKR